MPQTTPPGVTRDEWLALVYWGGLSAYCTGYAIHEKYTVYVSLIQFRDLTRHSGQIVACVKGRPIGIEITG